MNPLTYYEWDIAIIAKLLVLSTLEDWERWKKEGDENKMDKENMRSV